MICEGVSAVPGRWSFGNASWLPSPMYVNGSKTISAVAGGRPASNSRQPGWVEGSGAAAPNTGVAGAVPWFQLEQGWLWCSLPLLWLLPNA